MSQSGYNRHYDNRRSVKDVLRFIIAILAVLLILAVVFLVVGRQFLVYTDDGVRLELPFFHRSEQPPDSGSTSIKIIEVGPSTSQPAPGPGPEPDPEPEPEFWMRAVSLTLEQLEEGGAQAVLDRGANTVVVDMKREDGVLNYPSQLPLAQGYCAQEDRISPLIQQLHDQNIRVVAQVSCFRDDALGRRWGYAILTNSGYHWRYDEVNLFWTSPTNPEVQEYVAQIVGELAGLGFDEILLQNCGYPTSGELGWIRQGEAYDRSRLSEVIDAFLAQVIAQLEDSETVLSVRITSRVLTGEDNRSGLTAAGLEQAGVGLWLDGDIGQTLELAGQAGISNLEQRLVLGQNVFQEGDVHLSLTSSPENG